MKSDTDNINYEQAAIDLEAAASLMSPYINILDSIIALMDANNGERQDNMPSELMITIDDLYNAHSTGERAFMRHLAVYPDLKNEWICGTRRQMAMTFISGQRAVFAEKVSVLKHCAAIARGKAGLPSANDDKKSNFYLGNVHIGDKYSAKQAGAIGLGAHAHDMTLIQNQNTSINDLDLTTLASELSDLLDEMRTNASAPEHEAEIGNIAAATRAAIDGDEVTTLKYLKMAGEWTLNVGQKIGVGVAIAAIKSSLGL